VPREVEKNVVLADRLLGDFLQAILRTGQVCELLQLHPWEEVLACQREHGARWSPACLTAMPFLILSFPSGEF
jgi:hypothetical protein